MGNLKKSLKEELERFNQIGYNATNLEEQIMGSSGSGFVSNQGTSENLKNFNRRQKEMREQDDVEDTSVEDEVSSFAEMGVGDEDVDLGGDVDAEIETTTDTPPAAPPVPPAAPVADVPVTADVEEDSTEIEVTDLIDKQENLEKNTEETNDKLESLMDMLDGMEEKLSGMDQLMNQISSLEQKIEQYRPKTEDEKIEMRKLDSGPYNQTLANFWEDGQEKFQAQGKQEYVLTTDDVNNFSDSDMKQSFDI